mgnify:CR=1 FL=1
MLKLGRITVRAVLSSLLLLAAWGAQARTVAVGGVNFEDPVVVEGVPLQVNGSGVRTRLMFKVYSAALYTQTKVGTTEAFHKLTGPKRIHVIMLRDVPGDELGKLFTRGLEANLDRATFSRLIPGIIKAANVLSECRTFKAGMGFMVDWVPARGAVINSTCITRTEVINEAEAFAALLNIWLGPKPADDDLKASLLGAAPKSTRDARPGSGESAN